MIQKQTYFFGFMMQLVKDVPNLIFKTFQIKKNEESQDFMRLGKDNRLAIRDKSVASGKELSCLKNKTMQYTEEFKRGIVRMLLASGMTRREFAAKTKITLMTLRKWVKQYKDEEIEKVDDNNHKKYSEEYKKRIVTQMLFDGITYKTMAKKTGISPQTLEYWDNKYRYIIIADHEKMINRRRKKVKTGVTWHRYGAGAGRYE